MLTSSSRDERMVDGLLTDSASPWPMPLTTGFIEAASSRTWGGGGGPNSAGPRGPLGLGPPRGGGDGASFRQLLGRAPDRADVDDGAKRSDETCATRRNGARLHCRLDVTTG
jgi:hypothetical protein